MFTGRTIEELIQTVDKLIHSAECAEQHAREQGMELQLHEHPLHRTEWQKMTQEMIEVA